MPGLESSNNILSVSAVFMNVSSSWSNLKPSSVITLSPALLLDESVPFKIILLWPTVPSYSKNAISSNGFIPSKTKLLAPLSSAIPHASLNGYFAKCNNTLSLTLEIGLELRLKLG